MSIQNVVLAAGGESDGQGLALPRKINNPRRAIILLEEVIPSLQHVAVHQHDGASDVASFGKFGSRAHADIHHPGGRGLQSWSPRNRVRTEIKLHRSHNVCFGVAFGPSGWDGELFRVHRLGAGGLEGGNTPLRSEEHTSELQSL